MPQAPKALISNLLKINGVDSTCLGYYEGAGLFWLLNKL